MGDTVLDALATLLQTITTEVNAVSISVISRDRAGLAATPVLRSESRSLIVLLDLGTHNDVDVPAGPRGFSESTKEWATRNSELRILSPLTPSAAELHEVCQTLKGIGKLVIVITELERATDWMSVLDMPTVRLRFPESFA